MLQQIIECGFAIAAESTEDYADDEESPHTLSMYMLYNYASEVPNNTIYPIFKTLILQSCNHPEPLFKKAGLKVLGHVCDSDGLLDCIKDDIEELTDLLVAGLVDQTQSVREGAAIVVGQFSENVVPEFLELHGKVMPCLFQMLQSYIDQATTSQDHALNAEKALFALAEFASQMEDSEIKPYVETGLKIIDSYLNGAGQKRSVRYQALNCLSAYILASQHLIHPYMTNLLQNLHQIIITATDKDSQQVKG